VEKIQSGAQEVARYMNDNAAQLLEQNSVMVNTVTGIRQMIDLLKRSIQAIKDTDFIQKQQQSIIMQTVEMNEDIFSRITEENREFNEIVNTLQVNAQEITEMVQQVDVLNRMVTDLEEMLK
jgi:TRAP-type mannitol/chloroaromatic compound transport system substrate-binding protein